MRLTSKQENARTLAALMGVEEEDAAERLNLRIAVTADPADPTALKLAQHIMAMLSRTVAWAGPPDSGTFSTEVVIGGCAPQTQAETKVWAGQDQFDFIINTGRRAIASSVSSVPPGLLVVAACYVAASAMQAALGKDFPHHSTEPIVLRWSDLFGPDMDNLRKRFDIGETYLAGAGAVGNGFLYTLRHFNVAGTLCVVDPKRVNSGGLNRCLLVNDGDIGAPKATRLCEANQGDFPNLRLVPSDTTLGEARKQRGHDFLIDRLVVAVDSRTARRSLQTEIPRAVYDASTTDIREVVLHFNQQPTELACLSCIYPHNERERRHEENVAAALGITVDEARAGFCTHLTAEKICRVYPDARIDDLVGRAFDTVYKEFCGMSKLRADGGQQVLAPFSFVSVLAGAYLAVEFLLRSDDQDAERFNYWRVSPWHSPVPVLRQTRPRDVSCEFCGNPVIQRELARIFPR